MNMYIWAHMRVVSLESKKKKELCERLLDWRKTTCDWQEFFFFLSHAWYIISVSFFVTKRVWRPDHFVGNFSWPKVLECLTPLSPRIMSYEPHNDSKTVDGRRCGARCQRTLFFSPLFLWLLCLWQAIFSQDNCKLMQQGCKLLTSAILDGRVCGVILLELCALCIGRHRDRHKADWGAVKQQFSITHTHTQWYLLRIYLEKYVVVYYII